MRQKSIQEIIDLSKIRTDTVYSNHTSSQELLVLLSTHVRDLYNIMTGKDESLFLAPDVELTLVNGYATFPDDFYKVSSIFTRAGDFEYPLDRTSLQARGQGRAMYDFPSYTLTTTGALFMPRTSSRPITLRYLPLPPDLLLRASGTIGDGTVAPSISFTAKLYGADQNGIQVVFSAGGTAGSETVVVIGQMIIVGIEDGVSTMAQVVTAIGLSADAAALVTPSVLVAGVATAGTSTTLSGALSKLTMVCNEDEYLSAALSCDIATREESDTTRYEADKMNALSQILKYLSPRDQGSLVTVRNIERERVMSRPIGYRR